MPHGKVKWFSQEKGYGFVKPESSGEDVFVHHSVVEKAGITLLVTDDKVVYETEEGRDGRVRVSEIAMDE